MNSRSITKRENKVHGISKKFFEELQQSLSSKVEVMLAITSDGNTSFLIQEGETVVEKNPCDDKFYVIKVPDNSLSATKNEIVGREVPKSEVARDSQIVKDFTEGKIVSEIGGISYGVFENCGYACTGGSYMFWC
jgi:hypothetical protein